jgi:hypothetical protein
MFIDDTPNPSKKTKGDFSLIAPGFEVSPINTAKLETRKSPHNDLANNSPVASSEHAGSVQEDKSNNDIDHLGSEGKVGL